MNVTQVKLLTWVVAVGLTAGLSYYVYGYVSSMESRRNLFDETLAKGILDQGYTVEEAASELVAFGDVKKGFQDLDWTGREKPKIVELPPEEVNRETPAVPVTSLISILYVQHDADHPESSEVFLTYKAGSGAEQVDSDGEILGVGDRLAQPLEYIRLESIALPQGVVFAFDDEERELEMVSVLAFDTGTYVVGVGPGGAILPSTSPLRDYDGASFEPPEMTTQIGSNRFQLGLVDMQEVAEDYPNIISRELRYRRHKDPKTGRYDGIELQEVEPNGTIARHGGQSGDVLKSINGHPVSSPSEAITFVKNNKDKYTTWEVVVDRMGSEVVLRYDSPSTQP